MKNIGKSGRICNDPEKKEILRSWRVGLLPKSCLEVKSDRRPWETELPVFPVMGVGWGAAGNCQVSPAFSLGGALIFFFAQGDLGSSHTSACRCDARGGLKADQ